MKKLTKKDVVEVLKKAESYIDLLETDLGHGVENIACSDEINTLIMNTLHRARKE